GTPLHGSRMLTGREPLAAARGTFLAATAEALPLATGAIDLVFLSLVYHHLGAKTAALAEVRRVARAGGHVIVRQVTREYYRKISLHGLSSLQAISDGAFARGLAAFERHCRAQGAGPVYEAVELFVVRRT